MSILKKLTTVGLALTLGLAVVGCGGTKAEGDDKNIIIGVCPGPYGDMVNEAIKPELEKKGYKIEIKEFSDYVLPDQALANKEIDANLMQHTSYLTKFCEDNKLELSAVKIVPTAGMGIFSNTIKSLEDIKDGAKIGIPNDPSNLARSLKLLNTHGLIKIKDGVDQTKATVKDITENPHNFEFIELEGAQLARSLDSTDIGLVPGNYAIASNLDFADALAIEKLDEGYKNVVAVRTEDLDKELGKDLKEAVESQGFRDVIENGKYKNFDKPEWYVEAGK